MGNILRSSRTQTTDLGSKKNVGQKGNIVQPGEGKISLQQPSLDGILGNSLQRIHMVRTQTTDLGSKKNVGHTECPTYEEQRQLLWPTPASFENKLWRSQEPGVDCCLLQIFSDDDAVYDFCYPCHPSSPVLAIDDADIYERCLDLNLPSPAPPPTLQVPEPAVPEPVLTSASVLQGTDVLLSAGIYEVELNWEGEAQLHNLKKSCQKHRDHENFIPVYEFDEQHLPALYRNKLIIDLVRCLSALTVRVRVDKVSPSRPKPPYPPNPRYNNLCRNCTINGTGHVGFAVVCAGGVNDSCACPKCLESGCPETCFGKIFIQTAAHVVHDDNEAANTVCYFNYTNDIDGLDAAIQVQGARGVQIDVKEDRCWMFCYTHDLSLVRKLKTMTENYQKLRTEIREKYCVNWSDTPEDKLTIIVSHPHGCSKYVTVGNVEGRLAAEDDPDWTQYTYTTPTCPGSSGAPIFMLGKNGYIDNHHHSGTVSQTGLNVSTFGLF